MISVIVPTHNRPSMLRRALASLVTQSYSDLEILVIDDASTVDMSTVVRGMNDSRVRYIRHERNRGAAAARNTGIDAARGVYVAFLDDDDEWEPKKAEIQVKALEKYDAVLTMSDIADGRGLRHSLNRAVWTIDDFRIGMPPVGGTSALMARTDLIKELRFDERLPRCQDWDLLIRLAQRVAIGFVPEQLVRYNDGEHLRITNAAVTTTMGLDETEKRLRFFEKHRAFFGQQWYRYHLAGALLYGIRHQPQKTRRILDAVRRCGVTAVVRTLAMRLQQMARG